MSKLMPPRNTAATIVRTQRFGRNVVVSPRTPEIERALASSRLVVTADVEGRLQFVRKHIPLQDPIGSNALVVPAGLEAVVGLVCRNSGHRFVPGGGPTAASLPPIQMDQWPDSGVLDLIRKHDAGVIRYRHNMVDPAIVVAQVARAWPHKSIAMVCSEIQEGRRVREVLRANGVACFAANNQNRPGFILGPGGKLASEVGRVVVTTPAYTVADGVNIEQRDFVFIMEPQIIWNRASSDCLDRARTARVYGFLPLDMMPLAPWDSDRLCENFGFHSVTIPAHGRVERPVIVRREKITKGLDSTKAGADRDRDLIEGPGLRNRYVAKLAQKEAEDGDVYILVDSIAHALFLAEELPDSGLESAGQVNPLGLSRAQRARLARAQNPTGPWRQPLIITTSALVNRDISRVSTLICALSGSGLPPLTIDQLSAPYQAPPLRIIDLDDRRTPGLRRDSRRRHELMLQREWFEADQDLDVARAEHFIATRPNRSASR